jgi:O-antigen ligase
MRVSAEISLRATLAGSSLGLLIATPLVGYFTGLGPEIYVVPLAVLVLAAALGAIEPNGLGIPPAAGLYLGLFTSFISWMGLASVWSIPGITSSDDLTLLAAMLSITVASAIAFDESAVEVAILSALTAAVCVAGYVFWVYWSEGSLSGYGAISEIYLLVAQITGLGAVLAVVRALTQTGRRRLAAVVLALVLLLALALSLARGALFAAVLVILAAAGYWNLNLRARRRRRSFKGWLHDELKKLGLVASVLGGVGLTLGSALQVERTRLRVERLLSGRELAEGGRGKLWREAWEAIANAPFFGYGLGSSGVMSGTTEQLYPHNWALQVWLDGGLIGLMLCVATLSLPIVYVMAQSRRPAEKQLVTRWLPLLAVYIFLLLEYSKSSDFYSARLVFVIGLTLIYAARSRQGT